MRWFSALYRRVMRWSSHPKAGWYLAGLSFAESSFFPIPPDVMLAPMTLARPALAWRYAALTTLASVAGGLAGYAIGYFALDLVESPMRSAGYWQDYLTVSEWFATWGFWAVLVAGFSPIPYKLFTISAGALAMNLPLFVVASVIGRGGRFFLVAGLIYLGGERMEAKIRQHVDLIGWIVVGLIVLLIAWFKLRG